MKKILCVTVSAALLIGTTGCASIQNASNTQKGAVIGTASGAAVGAGVGALIGGGKGALIGGVLGTAAGATAGVLIGKKMDKQKEELAKIEGAQVETVTDQNELQAIKVTFESGILFGFNKSTLSESAKKSLSEFAVSLKNNPSTDVTIYGYTDNVGTLEANQKVSQASHHPNLNHNQTLAMHTKPDMHTAGQTEAHPEQAPSLPEIRRINDMPLCTNVPVHKIPLAFVILLKHPSHGALQT